ncbi:hypothetical protein [Pseudomonas typographi]|uniref:Transposase n=1 Tax=Pseudomonas typographi TaxID=2715964 RepID=A0ABR7Z297_9PSED|nr:hypothetical protein [Pseudomonas typographi]MBD1599621.1 hypothetical protein [Pseudomonas typographi]
MNDRRGVRHVGLVTGLPAAHAVSRKPEPPGRAELLLRDTDLGRPIEVVTDMSKSRALGVSAYQATDQAFFRTFEPLHRERLISSLFCPAY